MKKSRLLKEECGFEFETVEVTTNRIFFQIIDSLMPSWGLCLTCLDYKHISPSGLSTLSGRHEFIPFVLS